MHLVDFPGCCTAKVITGFGQTRTAEYEFRPDEQPTRRQMAETLAQHLSQERRFGRAIVTITTNDQQVDANAVLLGLGFEHSKWTSKRSHPDTKLRLWYFSLDRIAEEGGRVELLQKVREFA